MILKNYLTIVFVFIGLSALCQSKVCSSQSNDITDLNTIGKCAIENFKKSNEKEFVVVSTRSRFVRKRNNQYLTKLKNNVNTVASSSTAVAKKFTLDNVETLPLFQGCTSFSSSRKCFNDQIDDHIAENFNYPEEAFKRGVEDRVLASFTIDNNGIVTNIVTSSSKKDLSLENEAKRIISKLPKLTPARQNGVTTAVTHKVYINFDIHGGHETSTNSKGIASNEGVISNFVRFDEVSEKPVFVTCADYENTVQQECIKETILQDILDPVSYTHLTLPTTSRV